MHCHDLGRHPHCYGVPTVHSPKLDALTDRAFSTAPQCSPSRASMVTGRYPHSHGVIGLSQSNFAWNLHDGERHFVELLRGAGYRTSIGGLHHAGRCGEVLPEAFSSQQAFATEEEIACRCGFERAELFGRPEVVADRAIAKLNRPSRSERPFFLKIGFGEPHRRKSLIAPDPDYEGFVGDYIERDDSLGVTVSPISATNRSRGATSRSSRARCATWTPTPAGSSGRSSGSVWTSTRWWPSAPFMASP